MVFECRATFGAVPMKPGGRVVSFLPSAHIADRSVTYYLPCQFCGATLTSLADAKQIGATLAAVRPTAFGAVPRLWEKFKAGLEAKGILDPSALTDDARAVVQRQLGLDQAE